jgi:hypothetical protein
MIPASTEHQVQQARSNIRRDKLRRMIYLAETSAVAWCRLGEADRLAE